MLSVIQAFVTRLISKEDSFLENIHVSPKSKVVNMSLSGSDSDIEVEQEVPAVMEGVYSASFKVKTLIFYLNFVLCCFKGDVLFSLLLNICF